MLILGIAGCGGGSSSSGSSSGSSTKTLTAIAVTPGTASIAAGATQQFTATATYSDGTTGNVSSTATWTATTTTVATISATGMATGVAAGSTTVTAALSGVSGTAALTVTAATATVSSIAITPGTANLTVGATQQFTATATYSNGTTANVSSTATWTSSSTAAATISSTGLATAVASGSTTITASLSGVSGTATLTVVAAGGAGTPTSIAITPNPASFAMGATQQFTATATYSNNTTANITTTVDWTVANDTVATITSGGLATAVASGTSTVTASLDGVSGTDAISVTIAAGTGVNVSTWHVDNNRSGLNASEQSLTPTNVTPQTFGKLFSYSVDAYAYAEPLLMSNVTINGSVHNVLYVATENDSVYAFDADNYGTGAPLWKTSLLKTGETPVMNNQDDLQPDDGVTSTPVIDPTSNTLYVVSKQTLNGTASFRLSALDITTGAQKFGGPVPVTATIAGTNTQAGNGTTVSLTTECIQRTALLLANGNVYFGFGNCPTGWLLAYNDKTLVQDGLFNASPNIADASDVEYGSAGGIWMGSGGAAADSAGNVYVATGNGPWDGMTAWGDSVLKFDPALTKVQDFFTPQDQGYMDCNDGDLDSGGVMLIPGTSPTQLMVGGKTGKIYVLNTTNLGHEAVNDTGATQTLYFYPKGSPISPYSRSCTDSAGTYTTDVNSYENWGIAAYFNGEVYLGICPTSVAAQVQPGTREFTISGNTLTPGTTATPNIQQYAWGTTPFISANGTSNGIMWMIDEGTPIQAQSPTPMPATNATLRAYDATNLTDELYNSSVNSADVPGLGIKFSSPIVANGKVYISTGQADYTTTNPQGEINVYGLH